MDQWDRTHRDPIDENALAVFLCDEAGALAVRVEYTPHPICETRCAGCVPKRPALPNQNVRVQQPVDFSAG